MFGREAQHKLEKWTQSDLTGLKKRGQLDWKLGKRGSIGLNINTVRDQSDLAWLFEGFEDAEKGTQSNRKSQKRGSSSRNLPTMPKNASTPPPPRVNSNQVVEDIYCFVYEFNRNTNYIQLLYHHIYE